MPLVGSYSFHHFEHTYMMSKTPVCFQDLELANFSFNTLGLWIVPFQKGVTLLVTDYTGLLRNNGVNTFFQHHYNWLIFPTIFVHSLSVSWMPPLIISWCMIFGSDLPIERVCIRTSVTVCLCVCLLNFPIDLWARMRQCLLVKIL